MKKHIFSILVMVIIFTMAACVKTADDNQQVTTIVEENVVHEHVVKRLSSNEEILEMNEEEISNFLEELVISSKEDLCHFEINWIAVYLSEILTGTSYNTKELKKQATIIFDNLFNQIVENNYQMDDINYWHRIPVADILCKFYSIENIEYPLSVGTLPYGSLSEEDLYSVAKVFFENQQLATNSHFAVSVIRDYPDSAAADLAWKHIEKLSKIDTTFSDTETYFIIFEIFGKYPELIENDKIIEIAENILHNPSYDFIEKYTILCADFFYNGDFDNEKNISNIAYQNLYELSQNSKDNKIFETIAKLYNKYDIELTAELIDAYNINLIDCLKNWKNVSQNQLPICY